MVWKLFERKEKEVEGRKFFFEKWVEPESKSGIVFFSDLDGNGKVRYVMEGYGIGTIDPSTFKELEGGAVIQRYEERDYQKAREICNQLKEFNMRVSKGESSEELEKEFPDL